MENNLPIQGPVFLIETNRISPNPQQPRRDFNEQELMELASSIREFGIIQPIVVTKIENETETGTQVEYQLIAGERRWRAAKIAGLERIPAVIRSVNREQDRLELAIIENVQRANLNPIEAARAYAKLQDQFSLTQREIAVRIGKSRETIANVLRLLNLPTQLQEAVAKNTISESQARLLLSVSDPIQQQNLFEDILKSSLSVRELKSRIQKIKTAGQQEESSVAAIAPSPELFSIQKTLEELLGTKVKLESSGQSGKITISFYSPEELQGIIQKISKQQPGQEQQDQISL
ncbi:MAG: ParB/RepB/Spo0J family partition protein [Patescibacteria group bacterium]